MGLHVDTLASIGAAFRDDLVIECDCSQEEAAVLYYPPEAELPRAEQAHLRAYRNPCD